MDQLQATILPLAAHSAELKIAARWRHEAFLEGDGFSVADSEGQLAKLTSDPQGPETALIALIDSRLAGICLLVLHELEPAHDLSPWLASLYVDPQFRGRGVARSLVRAIEDHARRGGIARLHLYTVDAEEFYLKCGWTVVERSASGGGMLTLMTRDL
ncbi:MAG: GNAT family N-acetyltransferase [Parvibaculaceae bacterium]